MDYCLALCSWEGRVCAWWRMTQMCCFPWEGKETLESGRWEWITIVRRREAEKWRIEIFTLALQLNGKVMAICIEHAGWTWFSWVHVSVKMAQMDCRDERQEEEWKHFESCNITASPLSQHSYWIELLFLCQTLFICHFQKLIVVLKWTYAWSAFCLLCT